jgi:acetyl-CoA acetyltransferase
MFPTEVVILTGARTPMARYDGAFKDVSAIELGACAVGNDALSVLIRGLNSKFSNENT